MQRNDQGEHHVPTWPLYRSDEAIRLAKERAASYKSLPSISGFIRAFNELRAAGAISPVRSADPLKVSPVFTLTAADYFKLPASEVVRRYRDTEHPEFKHAVDELIRTGQI
jgi:hypothetical protein